MAAARPAAIRAHVQLTVVWELIRFNEAVDQAIAESVLRYSGKLDRARDILLAMLGHDLRNPVSSIAMSAQILLRRGGLDGQNTRAAERIASSASRTLLMVSDLLDFTRTRLGTQLPIERVFGDLGPPCMQAMEELRAAFPDRRVSVTATGDLTGYWDTVRIAQLMSNLVANAIQHGTEGMPVSVHLHGSAQQVELTVHNFGAVISETDTRTIFDPLVRTHRTDPDKSGSLGLGLDIARQIALAHGGHVGVRSSDERGTCFAVVLPRRTSP